jgi:hypothetical protein
MSMVASIIVRPGLKTNLDEFYSSLMWVYHLRLYTLQVVESSCSCVSSKGAWLWYWESFCGDFDTSCTTLVCFISLLGRLFSCGFAFHNSSTFCQDVGPVMENGKGHILADAVADQVMTLLSKEEVSLGCSGKIRYAV